MTGSATTVAPNDNSDRFAIRIAPALAAGILGFALLFLAGFAETDVIHNAAHDTRHAAGFPCH